eukprot:scaffold4812_cov88-Phaeocystis_antarctica.AAC.1
MSHRADSRPSSRLRQAGTCAAISSMGISLPHASQRSAVGASKRDSRLSAAASKRETSCGGAAAGLEPTSCIAVCSHKASATAPPLTPSRWRGVISPPMSACCAASTHCLCAGVTFAGSKLRRHCHRLGCFLPGGGCAPDPPRRLAVGFAG